MPFFVGGAASFFFEVSEVADTASWLLVLSFLFIVPPLLVILAQEIMSRAHANWAACAYPAACVLVAAWIDRVFGRPTSRFTAGPILKAGLAVNTIIGLLFTMTWVSPFSLPRCHSIFSGSPGVVSAMRSRTSRASFGALPSIDRMRSPGRSPAR